MAPAAGEGKARKNVGMATCAASLFDATSCLPYMVDAPLALVFDRRDMQDGQVVGCLQASDMAIAVDVQLPWVQLPAGSFVRFPQMRKGRIKLRRTSWMMTEHPDYGQLLTARNADEVKELFSENAFQKPPLVKVAPERQQEEPAQPEEQDEPVHQQAPVQQQSPARLPPQVLQQQQQAQQQLQVRQQQQQQQLSAQQSAAQKQPPAVQQPAAAAQQQQQRQQLLQLQPQGPRGQQPQQPSPARPRQEPPSRARLRQEPPIAKMQQQPSPARQQREPQQAQQLQQPPQPRERPPQQQQQRQPRQTSPPQVAQRRVQQPQEAPAPAAAARPPPATAEQPTRAAAEQLAVAAEQPSAAEEQPAGAPGQRPFTIKEARALQLELLNHYATAEFARVCAELDETWVAPRMQSEKLQAVDALCEVAMRPVVVSYGFEATAEGCAKAKAAVNELAKSYLDVRERKLAIQRQIFSLFKRLQPKSESNVPKADPPKHTEPNRVEHKLMPRLEPKSGIQFENRVPVAFWGICDLKFDPRLPREDSVRVLELGDGRASRFSGHGSKIKEDFERGYCLSESPLKRAIMVDNKKVTHDVFAREGFEWLRPPTAFYPRRYTPDLATKLVTDLGLTDGAAAVLKLVNRSRGAGVVVVTAANADKVLQELLTPPSKLPSWLDDRRAGAVRQQPQEMLQEACLHWWSNECPVFVAERCCHSAPVAMEGAPQVFDGTLRVAFALLEDGLQVEWLGGYWKLPRVACDEGGSAGSPEQLHERIVSSFNSTEKRTASVLQEHLDQVYNLLQPALPPVFQNGGLQPEIIDRMYQRQPLFRAFMLARSAAAIRLSDMARARVLLESARKLLPVPGVNVAPSELPERSALSYIERNFGVSCAIEGKWEEAGVFWRRAVRICGSNATAHYLEGCYLQVNGDYDLGVRCMQQSISLDPDFRSSYVGLSNCYLLSADYQLAMEACEACLRRFPDALAAQFNLAQAVYQLLRRGSSAVDSVEERVREGARVYEAAKSQAPDLWTREDERVLEWFQEDDALVRSRMHHEAVHIWRVFGWRP